MCTFLGSVSLNKSQDLTISMSNISYFLTLQACKSNHYLFTKTHHLLIITPVNTQNHHTSLLGLG